MLPSAPDPAALEALTSTIGLLDQLGSGGGLLLEREADDGPTFRTTASSIPAERASDCTFSAVSLLPKWLRVNRLGVGVPDGIGLYDALTTDEQRVLSDAAVTAAVPLLCDDHLIAWALLRGERPDCRQPFSLPDQLTEVADRLRAARIRSAEQARIEAVARSNRLSLAGQMAAGIAHEVRNPLAAVRSIVQLVRADMSTPEERARLLDNVINEVDRVNRVLSGMLSLGRPTAARDEPVDLTALVNDAVTFCQAYARNHGQTITMGVPQRLWSRGDAHELRQVLVNLLLNACQASQPGETIVVDTAFVADERVARIKVMDAGAGIPPEILSRVFEPFFTTKHDGGGLGLSICRDAMQRHGGEIRIASQPGVGTVVTLELPVIDHHGAHSGR